MPSFGYGVRLTLPHSRSALLSLSQNSDVGEPLPVTLSRPSSLCSATSDDPLPRIVGTWSRRGSPQAHVLRNHSVGSTCSAAGSGPWLRAVIRTHMSVGPALA